MEEKNNNSIVKNNDYLDENDLDLLKDEVDLDMLNNFNPNSVEHNPFYVLNPNLKQKETLLNRPARKQAKAKPMDYTQNVSGECKNNS